MPRLARDVFRIPLTSLLLASEQDVSRVFAIYAQSLSRHMLSSFRNSEQPTQAEIDRLLVWSRSTVEEIFGSNGTEVEALYEVRGTIPNVVKNAVMNAAKEGSAPIVDRTLEEFRAVGIDFEKLRRTYVRGINEPLPILSSKEWIDGNGHKLSTRIWKAGDDVAQQIDTIVRYEFSRGASPTRLAAQLEQFLTVEGAKPRTNRLAGRTGRVGSYSTRRLVRTELSRAHGNAVMMAAHADPFTAGIKWNLGFAHPGLDDCDGNAQANSYGLGVGTYPTTNVPSYPNHPHCLCYLSSVDVQQRERIRYGVQNNLVDVSGIDSDTIIEEVTGFVNAAA